MYISERILLKGQRHSERKDRMELSRKHYGFIAATSLVTLTLMLLTAIA